MPKPLRVIVWQSPHHLRSSTVCTAMATGIEKEGDKVEVRSSLAYRWPDGDVGFFYGQADRLKHALRDYPRTGRPAVHADLGYWGRKEGGRFVGFHKLTINSRHVNNYFQLRSHDASRRKRWVAAVRPWQKPSDGHILIAGMGPKGATFEGFLPGQWEQEAIELMLRHTKRPIWYRPKPNWPTAQKLRGAIKVDRTAPLEAQLRGAWAVVAHHSNAAIEAIVAGVPVFVAEGPALLMGKSRFFEIEEPAYPEGREQWLNDLAWTQWSVPEMASGKAWFHIKEEMRAMKVLP